MFQIVNSRCVAISHFLCIISHMSKSTKTDCQDRLRGCLARPGFSAVTVAGLAGVHPNTLRDFESAEWNPKVETLDRIMRVVDGIDALAQP